MKVNSKEIDHLSLAGVKKLETTATGAAVLSDSLGIEFGAGNDADIKYDGTNLVVTTDKVAASDLVIDCGANKTLVLSEVVWDDLVVPTTGIRFGGAAAAIEAAYKGGLVASFSSAADNYLYFTFQLPHTYKEGTDVEFHIHWTIPVSGGAAGAENVKWDFTSSASSAALAPSYETFPGATAHAGVTVDVQNIAADSHIATEIATITGSGFEASEVIICSLKRDVSVGGDYGNAVYLVSLDLHYQIDTMGSRQEWVK